MSIELLEPVVRSFVSRLADGDYDAVIAECIVSRLTADDLRQVIRDYGRTIIAPPENAYHDLDVVAVQDSKPPKWSVRAPLWTHEEGRSDLTLELTIIQDGDRWSVELDDLQVL